MAQHVVLPFEDRRIDVIRRLLDAGLSPATLTAMLPEFREAIEKVTAVGDVEQRHLAAAS